jgi:hypothetical protein
VQAHVLPLHAPTFGEVIENAGHGQQRVMAGGGQKENTVRRDRGSDLSRERDAKIVPAIFARGRQGIMGKIRLWAQDLFYQLNFTKLLEVYLFFFAITFEELLKSKICQINYPKLLELL